MENEKRLIDFEKARKNVLEILAVKVATSTAVKVSLAMKDATVDAVEVVRCKDCKHYRKNTGTCGKHSHFIWNLFDENHFCADGERKTE